MKSISMGQKVFRVFMSVVFVMGMSAFPNIAYAAPTVEDEGVPTEVTDDQSGGDVGNAVEEQPVYSTSGDGSATVEDDGGFSLMADGDDVVQITRDGTTTGYESLKAAVTAAADGDTIVFIADYSGTDFISYSGKSITIDLAGKSYTRTNSGAAVQVGSNAGLTIVDSVGGGSFSANNGIGIETKAATAVVTVNGGSVIGWTSGISADNATVTVNGGSVTGQSAVGILTRSGNITVSNGTVSGKKQGIYDYENDKPATITVTGGAVSCTGTAETLGEDYSKSGGIVLEDATTLAISGSGTSVTGGYCGIAVFDAAAVTVDDGAITGDAFGISGNGTEAWAATLSTSMGAASPAISACTCPTVAPRRFPAAPSPARRPCTRRPALSASPAAP